MKRKNFKNRLEYRNGRYYENGRPLRKKDYIFHASSHEKEYILTVNEKYHMNEIIFS